MNTVPTNLSPINRNRTLIRSKFLLIGIWGMLLICFNSCRQDYTPKPLAWPRLTYPESKYQKTVGLPYPISFEYPDFATLEIIKNNKKGGNWINLRFNNLHATLFTSYFNANKKEIQQRILENEVILYNQLPPYSQVNKQEFQSDKSVIKGYIYEINGNTASPVQFILTDQRNQLFRGVLYFNEIPNRDSIQDLLDGISTDIRYLMESFRFNN